MNLEAVYQALRAVSGRDEDAIQEAMIRVWRAGDRVQKPIQYAKEVVWRERQARYRASDAYQTKLARFAGEATVRPLARTPLDYAEAREQLKRLPMTLIRVGMGTSLRGDTENRSTYKSWVRRLRLRAKES